MLDSDAAGADDRLLAEAGVELPARLGLVVGARARRLSPRLRVAGEAVLHPPPPRGRPVAPARAVDGAVTGASLVRHGLVLLRCAEIGADGTDEEHPQRYAVEGGARLGVAEEARWEIEAGFHFGGGGPWGPHAWMDTPAE
jgi:hypothetical protein